MDTTHHRFGITPGRVALGVAVVAAFALGFVLRGGGDPHAATLAGQEQATASRWTCSMHPHVILPEAGKCPICFMDLIPLEDQADDDFGPRTLVMSESAAALADIRTTEVVRRSVGRQVRLIGTVAYDETRVRTIAAWVAGRVDTVFVDFTGIRVRPDAPLVSIYSPQLFAAQTELLQSIAADRALRVDDRSELRDSSRATIEAARERLRLWGLGPDQIAEVERRGSASHHLVLRAPIGGVVLHKNVAEGMYVETGTPLYRVADLTAVWVALEAYESDMAWLHLGQDVQFAVKALPGVTLSGKVVFIDPVLDARRRTVRVRLDVDNPDGRLKPGMFVTSVVDARLDGGGEVLVVPDSAPLITGKRAVVYVRVPGRDKPAFEGREVVLGPRTGDHYVVASGLEAGELVVVNGGFKIDSALQIQARPSMMNPGGGGPVPALRHGHESGAPQGGARAVASPAEEPIAASPAFGEQLDGVLAAYLDLQQALAGDDDADAGAAAAGLQVALARLDTMLLDRAGRQRWTKDLAALRSSVGAVAAATGMASRREGLGPLTEHLWRGLSLFGVARTDTVRRFHCPMAYDNRGGDWLQLSPVTANPYFGAAMARCGSQTDSLTVADRKGH